MTVHWGDAVVWDEDTCVAEVRGTGCDDTLADETRGHEERLFHNEGVDSQCHLWTKLSVVQVDYGLQKVYTCNALDSQQKGFSHVVLPVCMVVGEGYL